MDLKIMATSAFTFAIIMGIIGLVLVIISVKNMKNRREDIKNVYTNLKKGDKVLCCNGIYGIVKKIDTDTLNVEISKGVDIKISKLSINSIIE